MKANLKIKDEMHAIIQHRNGSIKFGGGKGKSVTDVGLDWLVNRMDSDAPAKMTHGAVGTGANTPQPGDTELQSELLRKSFSVSTNPATGKKHWEFLIDFSECNSSTLSEVGVFSESEGGTLLLRKMLDPFIEKTSDKKLTIIVEVTVSRV